MSLTDKKMTQVLDEEMTALDNFIEKVINDRASSGRTTFCRAGCSNCCNMYVQTTLIEAIRIEKSLNSLQKENLESYIDRQKSAFNNDDDFLSILRKQRKLLGPCPFLAQDGSCSIYQVRPLACRALLSTKPHEWCNVDFSSIDQLEKKLYLESLDQSAVAYPVHYLAASQSMAQQAESRLKTIMQNLLGISVTGNLPLLVHLISTLTPPSGSDGINRDELMYEIAKHPHLLKIIE